MKPSAAGSGLQLMFANSASTGDAAYDGSGAPCVPDSLPFEILAPGEASALMSLWL